jgi:hypothetical protein
MQAALQQAIESRTRALIEHNVVQRIWANDYTVWKPDPTEIADRLGWLDVAQELRSDAPRLEEFAASVRAAGLDQVLLLGMGVDYGIFLLEHPGDGSAWLAVALAGVSTLLAFGLLALSATPALHAFGLTMLLGELSIWLITPFLRPRPTISSTSAAAMH